MAIRFLLPLLLATAYSWPSADSQFQSLFLDMVERLTQAREWFLIEADTPLCQKPVMSERRR
ncbi:hypothetical protein D7Y19_10415 [Stenotrophomonas maltophilia]|nr:hypothetical protein [Stenotrophomonas maltophilia]MBA0319127.1 hypothetical protein [Stenotrophomonas maltophilia]